MIALLPILKMIWGFLSRLPWWIYVAIALVLYHFAAIHHYENVARDECNAAWQKKEQAAQAAYDAEVAKLKAQNAAKESEWQTKITEAGVQYANDLKDQQDQATADVAAARSGALKLRVRSSCMQASDRGSTQTSSDSGQPQAAGTCELPAEVTGRLFELANDANRVANKFNACLAILQAERK